MSRNRHFFYVCALAAVVSLAGISQAQQSARVMTRGLDEMAQSAELIVHGSVTSTKVEPHPQYKNLMTVVVTLQVEDTLKGTAGKTLTFRQYIWDVRDGKKAGGYQKGEEMLLLLGRTSQAGFRSPVGLEQGRFRIFREASGSVTAINGRANAGLFNSSEQRAQAKGIRLSAKTSSLIHRQQTAAGPIPLAELKEAVRSFAGVSK
jgi:hypothetical protein